MNQQPTGAVVIFVKTPGLSPVKTRLGNSIGKQAAEAFHLLSAASVEAVVKKTQLKLPCSITPYWAVAEEAALTHPAWQGFVPIHQGTGELGARLARVYQSLLAKHAFVILLGADSPQLSPQILGQAIEGLDHSEFVLGKADDGGFYLFGGKIPVSTGIWTQIPYSASNTSDVLTKLLRPTGNIRELPPLFDVDTVKELSLLTAHLQTQRDLLPAQKSLLEWLATLPTLIEDKPHA